MKTDEQKIYIAWNRSEQEYIKIYYHDISKWCCVVTPDLKDEFAGCSTASDNFDDLYSNSWVDKYLDFYKYHVIENNSSTFLFGNYQMIGFNLDDYPELKDVSYLNDVSPSWVNKDETKQLYVHDHSSNLELTGDLEINYSVVGLNNGDYEGEWKEFDNYQEALKEMGVK